MDYSTVTKFSSLDGRLDEQMHVNNRFYITLNVVYFSATLWQAPYSEYQQFLFDLANESKTTFEIHCHSIDRLGRSTLDLLSVWVDLTQKGITITCRNPNIRNIDENGKVDKFSELMMSIISTMSQFERNLIRERQMEGIRIRKEKGLYSGRRIGTTDTPERLLQKEKSKLILKYIEKGYPVREIEKIVSCSKTTITKVRKAKAELEGTTI
jgi:DNA invertase Pin-like site-specific DNA recombinase